MTASQITKRLQKYGFNKSGYSRVNFETIQHGDFETIQHGDFEINQLNKYGLSCIIITPKNGRKPEDFQSALTDFNTEVKNGYLIIKN